ncbi:PKD domain-containing protein [Hymenobacter cavernae]|uniref:PKD domain-containing protein n=1 Tax=Hymenobacter cavernae TaxID=2044852 RepID=A0ABQ1UB28_9BACT|nr:PKD domain-containing protein [Hymenobacter cavernae]GGF13095.1 hypothetical protein GCM10011383_25320 [Hymenobacter cavernae]
MRHTWTKAAWVVLASPLLFTACEKDDHGKLEGALPAPSFSSAVNATQFPVTVTFTDNTQNAFVTQWEFGDGTIGKGSPATHTYNTPGTYKVRLNASGKGGYNATPLADVIVPTACGNTGFAALVGCNGTAPSARVWTFSAAAGAIKRLDANNNVISSSAANSLASCQADDQFTFSGSSFTMTYTANNACGSEVAGSSGFVYKPGSNGSLGQIVLGTAGAFVGENVAVPNQTYDIMEASSTLLRLRGTLANGTKTEVTLVPFDAVTRVKQLLTAGTQKTWMLDNSQSAAITVGTEALPTDYYPGGAAGSLPPCQADDEFTFSASDVYTYDAKAETLVAGGVGCSAPRSTTSPMTFGPADGTGLAQFVFSKAGTFIGITDAPDLTYRILSITDKNMVLRAGAGKSGATVFTMKLVAK